MQPDKGKSSIFICLPLEGNLAIGNLIWCVIKQPEVSSQIEKNLCTIWICYFSPCLLKVRLRAFIAFTKGELHDCIAITVDENRNDRRGGGTACAGWTRKFMNQFTKLAARHQFTCMLYLSAAYTELDVFQVSGRLETVERGRRRSVRCIC